MALVYRHRNPKTLEVFYVGISSQNNYNRAHLLSKRNRFHKNYVSKNGKPIVEIIQENISIEYAKELEILLIEEYGRRDLNTGTLVNLTDGGEGTMGYKFIMSDEHKANIGKSNLGKTRTDEFKLKISKRHKLKPNVFTKESIEKISKANKNKIVSKETRIKMGNWQKGKNNNRFGKVGIGAKPLIFNEIKYNSIKEAVTNTGYTKYRIKKNCKFL